MDEFGGYFRIATNIGGTALNSSNNLYILDDNMEIVGKVEGIAPSERIYSTRFMGSKAYMVTFRTVDPLFVIDVSDPRNPMVLGELKIPGYSDYLHPYSDTLLIGFGKDTAEENDIAFDQGMKIAMFDVSDVSNPKELFYTIIGDRGTDSPLLRNHKALMFDRNRSLMAFPITVTRISPQDYDPNIVWTYGRFEFQGAHVYDIDLERGFVKRGEITHMGPTQQNADYWNFGDPDKVLDRIIYIGDTLYTTSDFLVKATNLADMQDIAEVELPKR
jgi:hypothetical protein